MTSALPLTNAAGKRICGRQKSRGRGLCQSTVLYANGCCRVHGGPSLSGAANANFKTGYRSKFLPERLAAKYAEALTDTHLVGLREEIALTDARLGELLEQLDTGESGARWRAARASFAAVQNALATGDRPAQLAALKALGAVLKAGVAESGTWTEIHKTLYLRKQLVDSESNRLKDMHQMMSAERAMTFVAALVASVRQVVTDPAQLAAIAAGIQKLVGDGKAVA